MLDISFNSFMRPANDTQGKINKAETELKGLKRDAEGLLQLFSPWIQTRLDAVNQKRKETGLKLQWLKLMHYKEK